MSKLSEIAQQLINSRKRIRPDNLPQAGRLLFEIAMLDKEAAQIILAQPNRLNQSFSTIATEEELVKFAGKYPHLKKQLIICANLPHALALMILNAKGAHSPALTDFRGEALLAQAMHFFSDRTMLAFEHHAEISPAAREAGLHVDGEGIPVVTRHTRHFNQRLRSYGSTDTREIIEINPEAPRLTKTYDVLKANLSPLMTTKNILECVMLLTKLTLPDTAVETLVSETTASRTPVTLDTFIQHKVGVCRHHALLNAYLLSRLVDDGILQGEVIHHRQSLQEGVHTWNLFRDGTSGLLYSLDSLWRNLTLLQEHPGELNRLYETPVEEKIFKRYGPAQTAVARPETSSSVQERELYFKDKLKALQQRIEAHDFPLKTVFFIFKEGSEIRLPSGGIKQVPDKIAAIHAMVLNTQMSAFDRWQSIQTLACKAQSEDLDAGTKAFLFDIIETHVAASSSSQSPGR